jgi:predicted helicase
VNSVGIVTSRDNFVIDFDKEPLKRRIRMFRDEKMPDEIIGQTFNLKDKANWKLSDAREKIRGDEKWDESITQILYRPFDARWIFYHDEAIERPRREVMRHMLGNKDVGLITNRQVNGLFRHALCSDIIINDCTVSLETRERSYIFPLYLYSEKIKTKRKSPHTLMMIFEPGADYQARKPNLSQDLVEQLKKDFKKAPSPEQIFFYIYAVLYSNIYRKKYAEFLKTDFPRIPFAKDYKLFCAMAEYGENLVALHLLKSTKLDTPLAKFQGKGDNKIEKLKYENGKVFINQGQYFEGLQPNVWEYQIGGYQVCEKWLKDRKGRLLSLDEIQQYCKIVTALSMTIAIQQEIDEIYPEIESNLC